MPPFLSPRLLLLPLLLLTLLFPVPGRAASRVASLVKAMSLEEKVGQLFMVWFQGPVLSDDLSRLIGERHLGGVILYGVPGNIESPAQVAALTAAIQGQAAKTVKGLGLLIGVDQEGGPVARLRQGVTLFPSQMAQAAVGRSDLVRLAASITGQELRALGINVDFTPVADVNVNPANPVIGIRSFGSDPALVARLTAAATDGYNAAGIICTPKHFPGHGDTNVDSHVGLPVVTHDATTLSRVDFPPFRAAFAAKAPAVMTAHVVAPALEPNRLPATLSARVLGRVLRGRMGFAGVIFTDSLGMGAVAAHPGTPEAAVAALAAGADVLLIGADAGRPAQERDLAMDAVLDAVRQGRLPTRRLNESVTRVLRLKERFGLLNAAKLAEPAPDLAHRVGTAAHEVVARRIAARSLTAVTLEKHRLPLPETADTLVVRPRLGRPVTDNEAEAAIATWTGVRHVFLPEDPDEAAIQRVVDAAKSAKSVVLLSTDALRKEGQRRLARTLHVAVSDGLVLVAAESPYDLPVLPAAPVRLAMYGETPVGLAALQRGLFHAFRFTGRCPARLENAARPQ